MSARTPPQLDKLTELQLLEEARAALQRKAEPARVARYKEWQ